MLGIALGSIVLGCILLLWEWRRYDFSTKAAALAPAVRPAFAAVVENPTILSTVRL